MKDPIYWRKIVQLPLSSTFTMVTTKACETLAKGKTVHEKVWQKVG